MSTNPNPVVSKLQTTGAGTGGPTKAAAAAAPGAAPTVNAPAAAGAPGNVAGVSAPVVPNTPQGAVAAGQLQPKPGQNAVNADEGKKMSMVAKVFQTLAGGQTTDYVNGPNGPVPVKRNLKPGEISRTILASAFSLLGSGLGGEVQARDKLKTNPYTGPSIGQIESGHAEKSKQQATEQYQQQQQADERMTQKHQQALEQQESLNRLRNQDLQYKTDVANIAKNADLDSENRVRLLNENQQEWAGLSAIPGIKMLTDADGKEQTFGTPEGVQEWFLAHPDKDSMLSKGGYSHVVVRGPDSQWHVFIKPPDMYKTVYENYGQKKDDDGNLAYYKQGDDIPNGSHIGDPVPDGSLLDSGGRATVATVPMSAIQIQQQAAKSSQNAAANKNRALQLEKTQLQIDQLNQSLGKNKAVQAGYDAFNETGDINKIPVADRSKVGSALERAVTISGQIVKAKQAAVDQLVAPDDDTSNADREAYNNAQAELQQAADWNKKSIEAYSNYTRQVSGGLNGPGNKGAANAQPGKAPDPSQIPAGQAYVTVPGQPAGFYATAAQLAAAQAAHKDVQFKVIWSTQKTPTAPATGAAPTTTPAIGSSTNPNITVTQ